MRTLFILVLGASIGFGLGRMAKYYYTKVERTNIKSQYENEVLSNVFRDLANHVDNYTMDEMLDESRRRIKSINLNVERWRSWNQETRDWMYDEYMAGGFKTSSNRRGILHMIADSLTLEGKNVGN